MTTPASALPPVPPTPAPQSAATAPQRRRKKEPQQSNVKETLEQILVAFIIAFIFRCFVVEAYVIPTGSMAPTLLGAHMDFRCPDCGWHWTANYSGDKNGEVVPSVAAEVYPVRCPNCGYKIPRELPGEPDNDATQPPVSFGDRILVQKYIYLVHEPRRWDVVVFKTPEGSDPEPYTTNFIKRLIGSPGETIMVLDGDVYVAQNKPNLADYTPDDFVIQTKPYLVQEAMWRVIYDNDHQPRGLPRSYYNTGPQYTTPVVELSEMAWKQPWTPSGPEWDVSGRDFKFNGESSSGKIIFDSSIAPEKHAMTDWLAYDTTWQINTNTRARGDFFKFEQYPAINKVGDLKLALNYDRKSGNGPLRLHLSRNKTRFTAELTPEKVRLLKLEPEAAAEVEIASAPLPKSSLPLRIEFANVDYRASVRINGSEVLASTPADFKPNVAELLANYEKRQPSEAGTASIEAGQQVAEISHVSLWRDVYYLNRQSHGSAPLRWAMPDRFPLGSTYKFENMSINAGLMQLGKDEFFVMGDNSLLSSDARYWGSSVVLPYEDVNVQGGRVPRRFMLGRAFFVYWPAGYSPVNGFIRFVPNFGEMRFIH